MQVTFKKHPDFPLKRPDTRIEVLGLLDKYFPGVVAKIDVDSLTMTSQTHCVLGQTIGWYNNEDMFEPQRTAYGRGVQWDFASDTDEWKKAINDYRNAVVQGTFKVGDRVRVLVPVKTQQEETPAAGPVDTSIDAKIAAAEAEVQRLKAEKQRLEDEQREVPVMLTKAQIRALLARKPSAVKAKLQAALQK